MPGVGGGPGGRGDPRRHGQRGPDPAGGGRSWAVRCWTSPGRRTFSAARNFTFSQATQDYCLWLDADDVLLPEDRRLVPAAEGDPLSRHGRGDAPLPRRPGREGAGLPSPTGGSGFSGGRGAFAGRGRCTRPSPPGARWCGGTPPSPTRRQSPETQGGTCGILEKVRGQRGWLTPREQFLLRPGVAGPGQAQGGGPGLWRGFCWAARGWEEDRRQACLDLSRGWQSLGEEGRALEALTKALVGMGVPRPELCCQLGGLVLPPRPVAGGRPSGTGQPWTALRAGSPGPSAAGTTPACSCACAGTGWGIWSGPGPGTAGPRPLTRRARSAGPTRNFSPRPWVGRGPPPLQGRGVL